MTRTVEEIADEMLQKLSAPFSPDEVEWRPGSTNKKWWSEGKPRLGRALAYVDARTVQDRFADVCGIHWQCEHYRITDRIIACKIGLLIGGDWLWRSDGAGETDMEGEKGAMSDAFKRAAVKWGPGRYLYALGSPKVRLNENWLIDEDEMPKLRALLEGNGKGDQPSAYQARKEGGDDLFKALEAGLRACKNIKALATYWTTTVTPAREKMPANWYQALAEEKDACKLKLENMHTAKGPAAKSKPAARARA